MTKFVGGEGEAKALTAAINHELNRSKTMEFVITHGPDVLAKGQTEAEALAKMEEPDDALDKWARVEMDGDLILWFRTRERAGYWSPWYAIKRFALGSFKQ